MSVGSLSPEEEAILRQGKTYAESEQGRVCIHLDCVTSVPVITLEGRLYGSDAEIATKGAREDLAKIPGYVILDMPNLEYMSSTMLGFIAQLALERHEGNHDIFLCSMGPRVRSMLRVLDMEDFFHIRSSLEEAVSDALICHISLTPPGDPGQ